MLKSAQRERQRDEVGEGADLCEREGERVDTKGGVAVKFKKKSLFETES